MLAGFFISNGVKALREPEAQVPAAEPLARAFVPFAQKVLPEGVSAYLPEETKNLVRLDGLLSLLGGLGMATGITTRGGATLAAASMIPHVVASFPKDSPDDKSARSVFLRNLALTGAALVVSQDTRGKPSLSWLAADKAARLSRTTKAKVDEVQRDTQKLSARAERRARKAAKHLPGAPS